jgi:hypothetical protein
LAFCLFALALYPLFAWLAGHGWPRAAMFGVAPSPTVIFTIGVLLMLKGGAALHLAALPVLWALIGAGAVFLLGVREDLSLLLAGLLGLALLIWKARRTPA